MILVSELKDAELDLWVAKAEEKELEIENDGTLLIEVWHGEYEIYSPSTNWSQGGPIIHREHIFLDPPHKGRASPWGATTHKGNWMEGPDPLIAAMRCYVASVFGNEVTNE